MPAAFQKAAEPRQKQRASRIGTLGHSVEDSYQDISSVFIQSTKQELSYSLPSDLPLLSFLSG